MPTLISGIKRSNVSCINPIVSTSLCNTYICPPRFNSRFMASIISSSFHSLTNVLTAILSIGGVAMMDNSRKPDKPIFNVRGIGVAVIVSKFTSVRNDFNCSLCFTPKRCSSSMITRPKFLNFTSFDNSLCVPMTISMRPSANNSSVSLVSLDDLKRDKPAIFTGQSAKRSMKSCTCCSANNVVGANNAT